MFVCLFIFVIICRMFFLSSREMFIHMATMPMNAWPQMRIYIFKKRKRQRFHPHLFNWHSFVRLSSTIKALILGLDTLKTYHSFSRNINHIIYTLQTKIFYDFIFLLVFIYFFLVWRTEGSRMGLHMAEQ